MCSSHRLIAEPRSQPFRFNLSTITGEDHTVPFGEGFQMALRQQAGTEDKLHPQTLSSTLTPPPIPLFTHFPFSVSPSRPRGALVVYFSPLTLIHYAIYPPATPVVAYLNRTCRMLSHRRTRPKQRGASPHPHPSPHSSYGGRQSPALRLHRGRWGYNAAPRAGSCQLAITAKKETHTRVHKHTRTSLLAPALIRGAIA